MENLKVLEKISVDKIQCGGEGEIPTEILVKMKLFRPNKQPLKSVEPFERILRAMFNHNARTNSLLSRS